MYFGPDPPYHTSKLATQNIALFNGLKWIYIHWLQLETLYRKCLNRNDVMEDVALLSSLRTLKSKSSVSAKR